MLAFRARSSSHGRLLLSSLALQAPGGRPAAVDAVDCSVCSGSPVLLSRAALGLNQLQELEDGLTPQGRPGSRAKPARWGNAGAPGIFVRKSISALGCIPKNKGDSAGIVS